MKKYRKPFLITCGVFLLGVIYFGLGTKVTISDIEISGEPLEGSE